jgi:flotillin
MYKSVPPLQEMFNMVGMQLPEYLKGKEVASESIEEEAKSSVAAKNKEGK